MATGAELQLFAEQTTYQIPFFDYTPGIRPGTALKDFRSLPAWGTNNAITYDVNSNRVFVSGDNVVVDGYDFSGTSVTVRGNNVTVSNSKFDISSPTMTYALTQASGFSGMHVINNDFDGMKADVLRGYINASNENINIRYNQFINSPSDAVTITNGVVDHNYFSGGGYATGAHADAIWVPRTTGPVSITNNFVDYRPSGDAAAAPNNAIRILPELGDIANVTVTNNVLLGGTYTVHVATAQSWQTQRTITDVKVTDNFIAAASHGDLYPTSQPADLVYQSNTATQITPFIGPWQEKVAGISIKGAAEPVTKLTGTAGSDHIAANGQLNYVDGEGGRDFLYASKGIDHFIYNSIQDSSAGQPDYIQGFQAGVDKLDLSGLASAYALPNGALSLIGSAGFSGVAGQVRTVEVMSGTTALTRVDIDLNGDKVFDMRIELTGAPKLSASDFMLNGPSSAAVTAGAAASNATQVAAAPIGSTQMKSTGTSIRGAADPVTTLKGTAGSDQISAHGQLNYIDGEGGRDFLYAGKGVDHFVYNSVTDSSAALADYIQGFQVGVDKLDLSALAPAYAIPNGALSFIGTAAFSGVAGQVRAAEAMSGSTALTRVDIDLNGDRVLDMRIELTGAPKLSAGDFFF